MVEVLVPMSFFAMITAISVGRPIARAYARRLDAGNHALMQPPTETVQRMERLESHVESLAIALERSIEEQRFLTRLLSERNAGAEPFAAAAPEAYSTPRAG